MGCSRMNDAAQGNTLLTRRSHHGAPCFSAASARAFSESARAFSTTAHATAASARAFSTATACSSAREPAAAGSGAADLTAVRTSATATHCRTRPCRQFNAQRNQLRPLDSGI